MVVNHIINL